MHPVNKKGIIYPSYILFDVSSEQEQNLVLRYWNTKLESTVVIILSEVPYFIDSEGK